MSRIFLSHAEDDIAVTQEIAGRLEAVGYETWYFERDVLPGKSYLLQIINAIEVCDAVVLIASPKACESDQVTKEVVGAFERGKPFFPVLIDITPSELKEYQPEWRNVLGGIAMITVGPESISGIITRVIDGLRAGGFLPDKEYAGATLTSRKVAGGESYPERAHKEQRSTEGERKQVTVMFADISGFTAMSEKMDPEEVTSVMNDCFRIMGECIEQHGGTIDKFIGDCVMALFGAPKALEDAPHRAIDTALALLSEIGRFNSEKNLIHPLDVHIGINTGPVVAGMVGSDRKQDFTVMGDTVNLASRMVGTAGPGTIHVAENTYHLTEGYFNFEDLGEIQVKGKEQPVKSYRVLGTSHAKTRITACLSKGLTPFVGRGREIEHFMDCYEQVKEGRGQVVGVVGEPGVGKSRLLSEIIKELPAEEYTCLEGGCLHYGANIAYLPVLGILKCAFDIHEDDNEAIIKRKIRDRKQAFTWLPDTVIPPLLEILSLDVDDADYEKLEPKQRRERVFDAIRLLLVAESHVKPLIMVVEDLHWIDKTSEEFLTYFIGGLASASILLVLLYRPEYTPAWVSKTYYSQIRVGQLSQKVSIDLVRAILAEGEVDAGLSEFIIHRTSGNPLYIEELTHNLMENGSIKKDNEHYMLNCSPSEVRVPDSIQGIIAARLDRLEETLRRIIQVASVIGREFAFRILETVTRMHADLKTSLTTLQDLEFIYEKSLFPELEYIFKHALTQEVAYNSLLLRKRKEIHELVGHTIEAIYENRLEEFYEMLAYHYSMSNNTDKAYEYLKRSADKAVRSFSNWEAVKLSKDAIRVLDNRPAEKETKQEKIQILLMMINALAMMGYPDGTLEIMEEMERIAKELGDEKSLVRAYGSLGYYHTFKGDSRRGLEYSEKCFHEAEKIEDLETMAYTAFEMCNSLWWTGEHLKVAEISSSTYEKIAKEEKKQELFMGGINLYAGLCAWHLMAIQAQGQSGEGEKVFEKGIEAAHEAEDWLSSGFLEIARSALYFWEGDGKYTIEHGRKSLEFFEQAESGLMQSLGWVVLGLGHGILGDHETARNFVEKSIYQCKEVGVSINLAWLYWGLAMVHSLSGELSLAKEAVEESLRLSRENEVKMYEGMAEELAGWIIGKMDRSRIDEGMEHILQGIILLEEQKTMVCLAFGNLLQGELLIDAGRMEEAEESLKKSEALYQEMGVTPESYWRQRLQDALSRLGMQ